MLGWIMENIGTILITIVLAIIVVSIVRSLVKAPATKEENIMVKTVLTIDGMACGMCESHVNDAIRNALRVKKVTSSHAKGETEILSEEPLSEEELHRVLDGTGYTITAIRSEPYEKKKFSLFGKK